MGSFFFLNPSARGARFIGGRYHPWSFYWIRAHHFVADEEMVEGGEREQIGGRSAAVQQELGGEAILPPLKGFRATPGGWLYFRGFSFEWFPSFSPAIPFFSFVAIRSIRAKPTAAIFSRFDRCSVFAGFTLTLENKWTCGQRINGGKRVHQRNINDNATFLFTIPIHENKSETSKIDIDICK